jgi:hypothetical protein
MNTDSVLLLRYWSLSLLHQFCFPSQTQVCRSFPQYSSLCFSADNVPVGAALWAADIEANNTTMTEMTIPKSTKEATKKAE